MASSLKCVLAATIGILSGCSWKEIPQATSGIAPYQRSGEQAVNNRGQWLFSSRLNGLNSSQHFVIEGQFFSANGKLSLQTYFNGFAWRDGVEISLVLSNHPAADSSEANALSPILNLVIQAPGQQARTVLLPSDFLSSDLHFKVRLEVHNNDRSGLRVLLWKYALSQKGEIESPRPFISEGNADFDTRQTAWIFLQRGHGVRWGVEFENAKVIAAYREASYVP